MTEARPPRAELLGKAGAGDPLRAVAEAVLQLPMAAGVAGLIGAGRRERSPERLNGRNGYRERAPDTRPGSLQLRIPKRRQGASFLPALPGAPDDQREGAGGGAPGGLERRRLDPPGGRAGRGPGPRRHRQGHGLGAGPGHRRASAARPA